MSSRTRAGKLSSGSDRLLVLCGPIHTDLNRINGGSESVSKMGVAVSVVTTDTCLSVY